MVLRLLFATIAFWLAAFGQEPTERSVPVPGVDSIVVPALLQDASPFPPHGARSVPIRPRFVWPEVRRTSSFILQIASDSSFLNIVYQDSSLLDTSAECALPLINDTQYYWMVGWRNLAGESCTSGGRGFMTAPAPSFSGRDCTFEPTRSSDTSLLRVVLFNPVAVPISVDSILKQTTAFGIRDSFPAIVPPRDSLRFTIVFRPSSFGSYRDTLTVVTSQGTARLPLAGESPPPILITSSREIRFEPIGITDTAETPILLRNLGLFNDLSISGISTGTSFFTPSRESALTVGRGDSVTITVRFLPKAARPARFGLYYDTLIVVSDGGRARIVLRGDSPPPKIMASLQALDFGLVGVRDSAAAVVQIRNGSINILEIDSIKTNRLTFRPALSRARVYRLDSLQLGVTFAPHACGLFADTLALFNNSWTSPLRVPLKGYSPYPALEANFERVNFGIVEQGDSGSVEVRLWNSSISSLRIDSIRSRMGRFRVEKPLLPLILRRGDATIVRVMFLPDSVRRFYDTLIIVSSSERRFHKIPLLAEGAPGRNESVRSGRSTTYELYQNFPNPFNTATTFSYNLPARSRVRIEVYTALGQLIAVVIDGEQDAGMQNVPWSANLTSGVYFFRLHASSLDDPSKHFSGSHKMIVVR